ncbi:MAG: PH domain-containing protein [Patescibacteria group bacterium]
MPSFFKELFYSFIPEPKGVEFHGEDKDEKILLLLRRHVVTNIPWILISFGMMLVPFVIPQVLLVGGFPLDGVIPTHYSLILVLFWYLVTITYIFESYLSWYSNVYIVTSKRLVDVDFYGILSIRVSEAPITNIEDVTYTLKGIAATIFNYGSVIVQTAGESRELEFELVPKPAVVHDRISDLATEVRNAKS